MSENDKVKLIKEVADNLNVDGKPMTSSLPSATQTNLSGKFLGEALGDDTEINELETSSKPEITVLLGFEGYGKTSFIASFYYQLLSNGEINECKLIDSDTLVGLERRLYLRRFSNSRNFTPETKRTLRGEPYLLSFHLYNEIKGDKLIIISDHSGEDYSRYASQKDSVKGDLALKYADRIIFFVDSDILSGPKILSMLNKYYDLADNLNSNKIINENTELIILFNKVDLIKDDRRQHFNKEKNKMQIELSNRLGRKFDKSFEVVSNKEDNVELGKVFSDIVSDRVNNSNSSFDISNLDWIKQIFGV